MWELTGSTMPFPKVSRDKTSRDQTAVKQHSHCPKMISFGWIVRGSFLIHPYHSLILCLCYAETSSCPFSTVFGI